MIISRHKIAYKTGLLRWEIVTGLCILAIVALTWYAIIPAFSYQASRFSSVAKKLQFLKTSDQLPAKSAEITRKADMLDSLLQASEQRERFSEPAVLEKLYELSDSTGCTVEKVQISEPITIGTGLEIPVLLNGFGNYEAVGRFIDGIENSKYASRVRQLTMESIGVNNVSIFLDFVILESRN